MRTGTDVPVEFHPKLVHSFHRHLCQEMATCDPTLQVSPARTSTLRLRSVPLFQQVANAHAPRCDASFRSEPTAFSLGRPGV